MYTVKFVTNTGQRVSQFRTPSATQAVERFKELVGDTTMDGYGHAVYLTQGRGILAAHTFNVPPGHTANWRGREHTLLIEERRLEAEAQATRQRLREERRQAKALEAERIKEERRRVRELEAEERRQAKALLRQQAKANSVKPKKVSELRIPTPISLTPAEREIAVNLGDGSISEGVRRALLQAFTG